MSALVLLITLGACTADDKARWDAAFAPKSSVSGEVWTVQCNAYEGEQRSAMARKMAAMLERVPQLKNGKVWVEEDHLASRVYYGEYKLPYQREVTGSVELSDAIRKDLRFIRALAWNDEYPFFSAMPVKKPSPDPGPPEWDLRRAPGVYALNVGVTYATPQLTDYKEAAVEWVKVLRDQGYEAYYHHDPERSQSSVCVGSFGADAFAVNAKGERDYSPAVFALRAKEDFKYNLENGHKVFTWVMNRETNRREQIPNFSFLVVVPGKEELVNVQ